MESVGSHTNDQKITLDACEMLCTNACDYKQKSYDNAESERDGSLCIGWNDAECTFI